MASRSLATRIDLSYPFLVTLFELERGSEIKKVRLNREISASEVRLVDADGTQLGIVKFDEALRKAEESGYDLAEIVPQARPPVVKLLDWGKYRYEQTKQQQKSRKRQKQIEVKGIRLGLKISSHDLEVKLGHAQRFLKEGHKVRVGLRFKGREITRPELGKEILMKFASATGAEIEQEPELSGRELGMLLGKPSNAKTQDPQRGNQESQGVGQGQTAAPESVSQPQSSPQADQD